MLRVNASIIERNGNVYKVEATAEGISAKFTFDITAASEREAAFEAIRRVENFDAAVLGKHQEAN